MDPKTCSQAYNSILFWCIYYWTKFFCLIHSSMALYLYYELASIAFKYKVGFANKLISGFSVL